MRWFLIAAVLLSACSREQVVIPENAVELRVALCPTTLANDVDPDSFDQELEADPFRLFADDDLTGPLGGINHQTAFGRMVSEDVWGLLVYDFENTICEVYASVDNVTPL